MRRTSDHLAGDYGRAVCGWLTNYEKRCESGAFLFLEILS